MADAAESTARSAVAGARGALAVARAFGGSFSKARASRASAPKAKAEPKAKAPKQPKAPKEPKTRTPKGRKTTMATKKRKAAKAKGAKRGGGRQKAIKLPRGRTAKAVKATRGAKGVGYAGKYSFATNKKGAALLGGRSG